MTIEDAQRELQERFGVNVDIIKNDVFMGYNVIFSYYYFMASDRRLMRYEIKEVPGDDWENWQEINDKKIRENLSIL
jgi:hypothetical protein